MKLYTPYDYLCDEPFYIEGIGRIKCPTLRDIRKVTYKSFLMFQGVATLTLTEYLAMNSMTEQFEKLSEEQKSTTDLYGLFLFGETDLMMGFLQFFLYDTPVFNRETLSFDVFDHDDAESLIGNINRDNFDMLRREILYTLGKKDEEVKPLKFKNKMAQQMYERMANANKSRKKSADDDGDLENMIRKYCTHNKVGINILNVWDLTYYQFVAMFQEYIVGRQADYSDALAANTFSYKKASDYKPMDFLKKLK